MKVLFINLPYYGHVVPINGLIQELIEKGCEVTYLMPFGWEEIVKESGAKFHGYKNHKQLAEQIKNAYAEAECIVEMFDLIVYEQFFFLGKHLSEKYHKPVVRVFTAPVTNKKLMEAFIDKGPMSIFKYKWISKAFTKDIVKDTLMKTDNWLDEIIYNPPALNLVYTLRAYQPFADEFDEKQYKFLGPSIYKRKEESFAFVKKDRPLIYISLGTIVKGAKTFFQKCIDAFKDENVDVIVSVGESFKLHKIKNVPSNIHLYHRVPQIEVLKISDVFVTHGGMNSISEAMVHKVPMLVIPFSSDQPTNAKCVEKLGIGKSLKYKEVTKEKIKLYTMFLLKDRLVKVNLAKTEKWIENALGNKGGAQCILDYYRSLDLYK